MPTSRSLYRLLTGLLALLTAAAASGCGWFSSAADTGAGASRQTQQRPVFPPGPKPVFLTVWHDKGEDGRKYFQELNQMYQQINPYVEIRDVSLTTDDWFERVEQAIASEEPPDLVFNDASRIIEVQGRTGGFIALEEVLAQTEGKNFVQEGDLETALSDGKLIVLPVNRIMTGLGVRKSMLAEVGGRFPETWADFLGLAQAMTGAERYGFAFHLEPNDSVELVQMLMHGSGLRDVWLTEAPQLRPHFLEPDRLEPIREIAGLYNAAGVMPKEAVAQDYEQMYGVVESGRAAMFRVGNWNVARWDHHPVLGGDYEVGPFPALAPGLKQSFVLGNVRGFAIPEHAANAEHAKQFVKAVLSRSAQESSFRYFGSTLRSDLQMEISPAMKPFFDPKYAVQPADTYNNRLPYYNEINDVLKRMMSDVYRRPAGETEALLRAGAGEIAGLIERRERGGGDGSGAAGVSGAGTGGTGGRAGGPRASGFGGPQ